nr:hypothetical protein 12 [bacterium]
MQNVLTFKKCVEIIKDSFKQIPYVLPSLIGVVILLCLPDIVNKCALVFGYQKAPIPLLYAMLLLSTAPLYMLYHVGQLETGRKPEINFRLIWQFARIWIVVFIIGLIFLIPFMLLSPFFGIDLSGQIEPGSIGMYFYYFMVGFFSCFMFFLGASIIWKDQSMIKSVVYTLRVLKGNFIKVFVLSFLMALLWLLYSSVVMIFPQSLNPKTQIDLLSYGVRVLFFLFNTLFNVIIIIKIYIFCEQNLNVLLPLRSELELVTEYAKRDAKKHQNED